MRITALLALLPIISGAGTVVPEVDTSTGQVYPAVLESRITGAYAAATNRANLAKSYADDAIATATADMVVADELSNAITLEAARRVAGDLAGSNNVTVAVAEEAALRVAGDLAGSNYADTVSTAAQSAAQSYAGTLMQTGTAARATSADYATVAGTATNATYATSAGTATTATTATYVLGPEAWITMSGTTGILYWVTLDGTGYVVTGTLAPDWTGVYRESGDYDPPRYYSADGLSMIWWWDLGSSWTIVDSDLFIGDDGWTDSSRGTINAVTEGTYTPYGYARGDATVTRVTNLPQTNSSPIATAADLDAALAAYSTNVTSAVAAEALLRVAGDLAGSNYADAVSTAAQSAAQAYAGTLMQTGTAARATSADYATVAGTATNATYATSAGTAGTVTGAQSNLIASALQSEADTLATVTARGATTSSAITIGFRGVGDVGVYSLANGDTVVASGYASYAQGGSTTASGYAAIAAGQEAEALHDYSYVWNGTRLLYSSVGEGTYNINPVGGVTGFYIGGTSLGSLLDAKATPAQATNIAEAAASAALATIPSPGVTTLSGVTPTITGATIYYDFAATNAYTLGVATNAPRYGYSVLITGTNAITLGTGISWEGNAAITPALTNRVVLAPEGTTNWNAIGRAY